ncbi:MAG: DUF424 family protein [Nanoarchaeota archaeon]|nr:DUF424 family protein [Nanoarchaeota archaeon]
MILVKIHKSVDSYIVCLCDSNLIGKKFVEGGLNLNVSKRFYGGGEFGEKSISIIKESNNLNVVGEESVKLVKKYKKIDKVIKIKKIPHAIVI